MNGIKWEAFQEDGAKVGSGVMAASDIFPRLQERELEAWRILHESNIDHVLYGMMIYGEDDRVIRVQFYMWPMKEEQFEAVVKRCQNVLIYALHRRVGI